MTSPVNMLEVAQAIRPHLSDLLTAPAAQAMEQRLDLILNVVADPEAQSEEIRQLLATAQPTQEWFTLYTQGHPAETILSTIRTYQPLPGKSDAIASPRYRCPVANCHQVWYRRDVNEAIPNCPIHDVQMVRDSKVTVESADS